MTSPIYECDTPIFEPLNRSDLPAELRANIRKLHRIEPARAFRALSFAALWGAGGWAALAFDAWPIRLAATMAIAFGLIGLSVLMHEGSHGLAFQSRRWSRVLGYFCGLPVLISCSAYRALHLRHHAHERTAEDPDDVESQPRRGLPLVALYYVLLIVGTYAYLPHVAVKGLGYASRRERALIGLEYLGILTAVALVWWLAGGATLWRVWLLPIVIAAQLTNLRSIAEHGLTTGGNPFTASRSVQSNAAVRYVLCNLNYHLEHHLYPGVPWYNLPELNRLLAPFYARAGASAYRSYTEFYRDFLRVTRSGVIPNVRLLPEHLREDLCA